MRKNYWYFGDKPNCRIPFAKDIPLPTNDSPVELNNSSCPTSSISSDVPVESNPADETETSDHHLREEEGQDLDAEERNDLIVLLNENKDVFRLGGEPTPFVKHFINTGDHPPVSTVPYRISPNRKELLKKENIKKSQDRRKTFADKFRKPSPVYKTNDLVWESQDWNSNQGSSVSETCCSSDLEPLNLQTPPFTNITSAMIAVSTIEGSSERKIDVMSF
ncbi:transposon Tf2-6 polyprotein [Nephila pilipes]|uniref:Transposon Tf2-6 polyprotein n=1 Tax=Nephila pilipes TaxID=299642 RepID=A0A8X6NUV5_NEPPI|nr:transposon Tf2-6 polyprotein [Nephila pilipes]